MCNSLGNNTLGNTQATVHSVKQKAEHIQTQMKLYTQSFLQQPSLQSAKHGPSIK
jgi:hypothetical protein